MQGRLACWIRQEGGCLCKGGTNYLKYVLMVLDTKERRGKIFSKGETWSISGCLKNEGGLEPSYGLR